MEELIKIQNLIAFLVLNFLLAFGVIVAVSTFRTIFFRKRFLLELLKNSKVTLVCYLVFMGIMFFLCL
jgi:hypothetical protein